MKAGKKISILFAAAIMLGCVNNVYAEIIAQADETAINYFTAEDYTNSDKLLKNDGSLSTATIQDFAEKVKNDEERYYPEITEVIPRQYLETVETNVVYQYSGKEYGFYIVKEDNYFDLLLIDIVYEFEDDREHNNEYKICIKPLLQQSFLRKDTDSGYIWEKYQGEGRYTYYVANPRFAIGLLNEHALNYGDAGYDKKNDDGLIIQQTRLNYGKISYKTEEDYWALQSEFIGEKALAWSTDLLADALDAYTFGAASQIKKLWDEVTDIIDHEADMYEQGKEVTVKADNEVNIFTNLSKQDQRNNSAIEGYSRAAYFRPKEDEEIILSAADDSYAEFIVALNDTNQESRLIQICDFDIVRRQDEWSSMERVTGDENESSTFYKERRLFQEAYEVDKDTMSYYLLSNGAQSFNYTPKYSGKYDIRSWNENVNIAIDDVEYGNMIEGVKLKAGKKYIITFSATQKCIGIGSIDVSGLRDGVALGTNEEHAVKYTPAQTGVYDISCKDTSLAVRLDIFGNDLLLQESRDGAISVLLKEGITYYIVAKNTTKETFFANIAVDKATLNTLENNESIELSLTVNKATFFQFNTEKSGAYDFVFYGDGLDDMSIAIFSPFGEKVGYDRGAGNGYVLITTDSMEGGVYYVELCNSNVTSIVCTANRCTDEYVWKVEGEKYTNGGLRRGATYKLELFNDYGEQLTHRLLMVDETYSESVIIETDNAGYTLTIKDDAKLFNDELTYFCRIYVKDKKDIELSFPITFQYEDLNVQGISLRPMEGLKLKIDDPTIGTETAKLYCSYNFDGGATIEQTIDIGTAAEYDLRKIKNFSQTYFNIFDFTIKYIEIYKNNVMIGKVYNGALKEYAAKVNRTYANIVDIGVHFESGIGSIADPFIINNSAQFEHIEYAIKNGELNYSFFIKSVWFTGTETVPMFNCTLNGVFDGNNYRIWRNSDDTLSSGNKALFEKIGKTGVVKNLNISLTYNQGVGENNSMAIVAIENYGEIKDSDISGIFVSTDTGMYAGGVVAKNYGSIIGCKVSGFIHGGKYLGGIAGYNKKTISQCEFSGSLSYLKRYTDKDYIGGIVGFFESGLVSECIVSGTITISVKDWESRSYQPYVGGIAGFKEENGFLTKNTYKGTLNVENLNADVSWWAWFKTHHFNQQANVKESTNI